MYNLHDFQLINAVQFQFFNFGILILMCLYVGGGSRRRSERDWPVMRASNIIHVSCYFVSCNYTIVMFFLFYKFKQCTCVFHKILVMDFM